jgi:hypothetical protein
MVCQSGLYWWHMSCPVSDTILRAIFGHLLSTGGPRHHFSAVAWWWCCCSEHSHVYLGKRGKRKEVVSGLGIYLIATGIFICRLPEVDKRLTDLKLVLIEHSSTWYLNTIRYSHIVILHYCSWSDKKTVRYRMLSCCKKRQTAIFLWIRLQPRPSWIDKKYIRLNFLRRLLCLLGGSKIWGSLSESEKLIFGNNSIRVFKSRERCADFNNLNLP